MIPLGVVQLVVGLLLCFAGARSVRLAAVCAGVGLGAAVAAAVGGGLLASLVVAAAGGVGAVLLVAFVARVSLFVLGALAGGVVGLVIATSLYLAVPALLVVVGVAALAGGVALNRVRVPLLAVGTAVAGAGLVVTAVARLSPLSFLQEPGTAGQSVLRVALWLAVAVAGWLTQRRRAVR